QLAEFQRVREWIVWPELDFPRTATGKPKLGEIRAHIARRFRASREGAREPARSGDARAGEPLVSRLVREISERADGGGVEEDLGLSSLVRVELLSALEQEFHVELDESSFAEARSVADIWRLLEQPARPQREYFHPRWTQRRLVRWLRLAVYYTLVW